MLKGEFRVIVGKQVVASLSDGVDAFAKELDPQMMPQLFDYLKKEMINVTSPFCSFAVHRRSPVNASPPTNHRLRVSKGVPRGDDADQLFLLENLLKEGNILFLLIKINRSIIQMRLWFILLVKK